MRPVLAPAARRTWCGPRTLRLSAGPDRAVLLEGLDPSAAAVVGLLDGVRTREQVVAAAPDPAAAEAALEALAGTGLLLDADRLQVPLQDRTDRHRLAPDLAALSLLHGDRAEAALQARQRAHVLVHGAGRVGAPLAALLAEAGVGTVEVHDDGPVRWEDVAVGGLGGQDVGGRRDEALRSRLGRAARPRRSAQRPDLVVLTGDIDEALSRVLVRDGVRHLRVSAEGLVGTVGPLVLPGRSACLDCVVLVRTAVDPDWPALVAQQQPPALAGASHGVLASAVAAQAALQVLELLEGSVPGSLGASLELELPGWRWRRRTWPGHPGCGCGAVRPGEALPEPAQEPAGPAERALPTAA